MTTELAYTKAGYKAERWKWVLNLNFGDKLSEDSAEIEKLITQENILQAYGFNKPPQVLPCIKKCTKNPWCLADIAGANRQKKCALTEKLREDGHPIGLQNTSNTCWINSALQALFHITQFRNVINSCLDFKGTESISSLPYLLQAVFAEMEMHDKKALACAPGNMFEKLAVFSTQKVMQKDQDNEVLKCVSEFLENIIDTLLADPINGQQFSSLFRTTLLREAKWRCNICQVEHTRQLVPDSCYTMAAYVSADECPLSQCILDLQTETQTGVTLTCDSDANCCGSTVKVDRVVTPKVLSLPSLLIIRNNSLADQGSKRRQHVVYPETLDLTSYTFNKDPALFTLRAVIFHHGYWIKHFSAHVKTESGKWFNFNDEKVTNLVNQSGCTPPLENNKNYFSLPNIANKYKHNSSVRVSRGAFIWVYEKEAAKLPFVKTPLSIYEYLDSRNCDKKAVNAEKLSSTKQSRKESLSKLSMTSLHDETIVVSSQLLADWLHSDQLEYFLQPSIFSDIMCEHRKFNPLKHTQLKCIRKDAFNEIINKNNGIHIEDKSLPVGFVAADGLCISCIAKHAHHIIYRETLKELFKKSKKELVKKCLGDYAIIGSHTINNWPIPVIDNYLKNYNLENDSQTEIDEETKDSNGHTDLENDKGDVVSDEKPEEQNYSGETSTDTRDSKMMSGDTTTDTNTFSRDTTTNEEETSSEKQGNKSSKCDQITNEQLFNEDLLCPHEMLDPRVKAVWIPQSTMDHIMSYCKDFQHPAILKPDFGTCKDCENLYEMSMEVCNRGKMEKKKLQILYFEKKRPNLSKDFGKKIFILPREFLLEWRLFVRLSEKDTLEAVPPSSIDNSEFVCSHGAFVLSTAMLYSPDILQKLVFISEVEWLILKEFYSFNYEIEISLTKEEGITPILAMCDKGCVEHQAAQSYEEQFEYNSGLINVRQVNSVDDIPSEMRQPTMVDAPEAPRKKRRINGTNSTNSVRATQRLARASKFFSSSDTMKAVQNFIAERTAIWPMLQVLWLSSAQEHGLKPLLLSDEHHSMTLSALRIKPNDTVYFKANIDVMEKASGDGIIEFLEQE